MSTCSFPKPATKPITNTMRVIKDIFSEIIL
nr:MAG TPA: hypothetical protein [Caudoviricetes sp.]